MRDYWGETMLERFQPDPVGLPTIWASRPMRDIRISVFNPGGTTLQTIYAARTGAATKTNPFISGDDGYAEFWGESAGYDIKIEDTQGPARIATKTVGWNAVNGEAGGIPPAQLANGILLAQLEAAVAAALWKPGDIKTQAGAAVPSGWLACDGSAVNRTTYSALFAALGGASSPWGLGDGSTTFNLPDLRGRGLFGAGTAAGDATATAHALGSKFGAEAVKLAAVEGSVPVHGHADTIAAGASTPFNTGTDAPDHGHTYNDRSGGANRGSPNGYSGGSGESVAFLNHVHGAAAVGSGGATARHTHSVGAHTHPKTGSVTNHAGAAAVNAHNNLPPGTAVTVIIKT
ncbi:MAG TPA: phage tail protein [Nitrospiraceae bacterium]|nr:phage tail protein [Nitrospiraceae bacterium]